MLPEHESYSASTTRLPMRITGLEGLLRGLSLLSLLCLAPQIYAEQDAGASHNLLLKADLPGAWFLISRSNVASRDNFGDQFLGYAGAGFGYQLKPSFSLRIGYRRAWFRFTDDWQPEDRGYLEGYFADQLNGFRVTDRLRAEFRSFGWRDDDLR